MTNDENYLPISKDLLIALKPRETLSKDGVEVKYNPKYCSTNWYIPFKAIKWEEQEPLKSGWRELVGKTPFGCFYVGSEPQSEGFVIASRLSPLHEQSSPDKLKSLRSSHPTLEAAKLACQEAFEVAILQCLGEDDDRQ